MYHSTQANFRIIETTAKYLKLSMDKFVVNVDAMAILRHHSIATVEAAQDGRGHAGDKVVFVAFGARLNLGRHGGRMDGSHPDQETCPPRTISHHCPPAFVCALGHPLY